MDLQGGLRRLPQRPEARRPASAPRQGRGRLRLAPLRQARGPASSPELAASVRAPPEKEVVPSFEQAAPPGSYAPAATAPSLAVPPAVAKAPTRILGRSCLSGSSTSTSCAANATRPHDGARLPDRARFGQEGPRAPRPAHDRPAHREARRSVELDFAS